METRKFKRNFFASLAGLALAGTLVLSSCEKNEDDNTKTDAKYSISGAASGMQEVPSVTTSAAGNLSGTYDTASKKLKIWLIFMVRL